MPTVHKVRWVNHHYPKQSKSTPWLLLLLRSTNHAQATGSKQQMYTSSVYGHANVNFVIHTRTHTRTDTRTHTHDLTTKEGAHKAESSNKFTRQFHKTIDNSTNIRSLQRANHRFNHPLSSLPLGCKIKPCVSTIKIVFNYVFHRVFLMREVQTRVGKNFPHKHRTNRPLCLNAGKNRPRASHASCCQTITRSKFKQIQRL